MASRVCPATFQAWTSQLGLQLARTSHQRHKKRGMQTAEHTQRNARIKRRTRQKGPLHHRTRHTGGSEEHRIKGGSFGGRGARMRVSTERSRNRPNKARPITHALRSLENVGLFPPRGLPYHICGGVRMPGAACPQKRKVHHITDPRKTEIEACVRGGWLSTPTTGEEERLFTQTTLR